MAFTNASSRKMETLNDLERTTISTVPNTPPPLGFYGDTRVLLMKVMTPVIITGGTLGNILTILVLLRQTKKISSTSMYLLALAISDTCLLWTAPFRDWMKYMWDLDVRNLGDVSCKIHLYFTYTFIHLSSWILVAVTLERAIGIVAPHKVKLCCTPRNAGMVITCIVIIIFGIDLVMPFIYSMDGYQPLAGHDPIPCAPSTKEFREFRDNVWEWLDLSLSFLVPFLCLLIGNMLIIRYLHKAKNFQRTSSITKPGQRKRRGTLSITILMIALCVIFFLTMTPVAVFQIYFPHRYEIIMEMFLVDPFKAWESYQYLLLQREIVNLVSYTNASLNFVLYVFSGAKFRAELKAAMCCSSRRRNTLFSSSKQSTMKFCNRSTINSMKSTVNEKISTGYKNVFSDSLRKFEINKNKKEKCSNNTNVSGGKDNLVFISDDGISSLSSILSKPVNKDTDVEQSDSENNISFDDVFIDYEIMFSNDTKYDILVGGKEMNGFILHL